MDRSVPMPQRPPFFSAVCRHYAGLVAQLSTGTVSVLEDFLAWAQVLPRRMHLMSQSPLSKLWRLRLLGEFKSGLQGQAGQEAVTQALCLIGVLMDHGRLSLLPQILLCVRLQKTGRLPVYLRVAKALDERALDLLQSRLAAWLGQPIDLTQTLDPKLIFGGFLVWQSRCIDLSLGRLFDGIQSRLSNPLFAQPAGGACASSSLSSSLPFPS
jgi:hypothetical protein